MLPAEARFFLEEFQSRMLLPPEVAAVILEVRGGTWMPQRSAAAAQCAILRSPCPSDDEDWAHCPHPFRPACVLGVFFVKKGGESSSGRKANALFAPPPSEELSFGDGLFDCSGLAQEESPGLHYGR